MTLHTILLYLHERSWTDLFFHLFNVGVLGTLALLFLDALASLALKAVGLKRLHERLSSGPWILARLILYALLAMGAALTMGQRAPVREAWLQLDERGEPERATLFMAHRWNKGAATLVRHVERPGRLVDALRLPAHDPDAWRAHGRFAWHVPREPLSPQDPLQAQLIEVATLRRLATTQDVLKAVGARRADELRLKDRSAAQLVLERADGALVRVSAEQLLGQQGVEALALPGCRVGGADGPARGVVWPSTSRASSREASSTWFNPTSPRWAKPEPSCPALARGELTLVTHDDKKFGDDITRMISLVEGQTTRWSASVEAIYGEAVEPFGVIRLTSGLMVLATSRGVLHMALMPLDAATPVKRWRWRV